MQIQVLSTTTTTVPTAKGSYQQLEVAYKNLTFNGKVEAKKLMSFGANASAFKEMATAQPASVWEVDVVKNDKGYNDWVKVAKTTATDSPASQGVVKAAASASSTTTKGGWETPEERAKRQIYIVRQSSIASAIAALSVGSKVHPTVRDIIDYAKEFEAYVFSTDDTASVVKKDLGGIEDIPEDIPF